MPSPGTRSRQRSQPGQGLGTWALNPGTRKSAPSSAPDFGCDQGQVIPMASSRHLGRELVEHTRVLPQPLALSSPPNHPLHTLGAARRQCRPHSAHLSLQATIQNQGPRPASRPTIIFHPQCVGHPALRTAETLSLLPDADPALRERQEDLGRRRTLGSAGRREGRLRHSQRASVSQGSTPTAEHWLGTVTSPLSGPAEDRLFWSRELSR